MNEYTLDFAAAVRMAVGYIISKLIIIIMRICASSVRCTDGPSDGDSGVSTCQADFSRVVGWMVISAAARRDAAAPQALLIKICISTSSCRACE